MTDFGLALGFCVLSVGVVACGARAELFPLGPGDDYDPPPGGDAGSTCTFNYDGTASTVIPGINAPAVQNVPAGVTPTASSILIQQGDGGGSVCEESLTALIADEMPLGSGAYKTSLLSLPGMAPAFEENITLAADGLTIIGLNEDDTAFVTTTRSAIGTTDFGPPTPGPFVQILAPPDGQTSLWAPVLSADGLAFYYTYVTALTVDRLTIFLEESAVFGTIVMTRASLEDPFAYPNPMPTLPGLRVRPIDGCAQFLGSCGNAGCSSEQICTWPAP